MGTETRLRVVGYVRVSTEDQAAHGTSIASQILKMQAYCQSNGHELVEIFEEPGLSGRDEGRPRFKEMLDRATSLAHPYDIVLVNNLARFARNLALQTASCARLEKVGIQLLSVTETFSKGPDGILLRSILGAFNQNFSDQSSRNTIRTMNLNAAEGFWNGGPIPFGYTSVEVERRKDKSKKKLQIHEAEAEVVRRIFRLARFGDGEGPMGVRAISAWMEKRGHHLRGGKFNNSNVAGILGRTHYIGYYLDGKRNEYKEPVPEEEWITVPCPAIVSEDDFIEVAALRARRAPSVTPPRVVNGVTMLPGAVVRCGQPGCGEALTVRSAKAGQYHYYTCSARANQGAGSCNLRAIRREQLDNVVLDELAKRVFAPERLRELLSHLLEKSDEIDKRRRKDRALAKAELTGVDKAMTNLMLMIESGAMQPADPLFVERMAHNRARKRALETDILAIERQLAITKKRITAQTIEAFALKMRQALDSSDPRFRSAYVRLFVDRVDLTADEIRIFGTKVALERALIEADSRPDGSVPIFDREWCA
jgi:site-specific DNA recombinase